MCGRYTLVRPEKLKVAFQPDATETPAGGPRYNIAPSQRVPIVLSREGRRVLSDCLWGFVPEWAQAEARGGMKPVINARAETLAGKPYFRDAFRLHRCLLPADGFFEWRSRPGGGGKEPFYLSRDDGDIFAFAGVCARLPEGGAGRPGTCAAIVTCGANDLMRPIHSRMPAILPEDRWRDWLNPDFADRAALESMLAVAPWPGMKAVMVSRVVNSTANDNPSCIEPAGPP